MLLGTVQGGVTEAGAPVAGLAVALSDAGGNTAATQTDANGLYGFTGLPAGDYRLTLTLPQHRIVRTEGGVAGEGAYSIDYRIGEGETRAEQIALEATGAIRGELETLGEGQTITAASLGAQATAITAQGGVFVLENLPGGDYSIYAPLPEGKTLTAGSDWRVSAHGDMIWITVSVAAGETRVLPEATLVALTGVTGVAYMDADGNRACGEGEQLMSGVPVALQRLEGGAWVDVADTHTDEYGHYAFQGLTQGEYRVVSQAVDGLSVAAVGAGSTLLGDPALGVVAGDGIRLLSGETATGRSDIALSEPASLRVAAFFDSNENGTRGDYERPIPNVLLEVVPAAAPEGAAVAQGMTGTDGSATVADIPAGRYVLRVTLPEGTQYTVGKDGWALDRSCVGGTNQLTAVSAELTLAGGQRAEAGVAAIPVGSFSGRVWNDVNNNGIMDEGEPGVTGATLTLRGTGTGNAYTITSGADGAYRFGNLRDDVYDFTAEAPEGMLFARYSQTGGDARSVFTVEGTRATRQFTIAGQQDVTNKNVGLIDRATIRGIAFLDLNYNGIYDEGEPPYVGVTLEVIKNSNEKSMGKLVTGEDGLYAFSALRGGDYRLRAILPADGSIFTFVPEGAAGLYNRFVAREGRRENSIASLKISNGETAETCVGVAMGGTVTGTVSLDAKYDGVRGGSDKKLQGVQVQLTDAAGNVAATASTNANGHYTLTGIMPGTYTVRMQRREGYAFTRYRPNNANGNHVKTLAKDGYGETEPIDVAMGQTIEGIDAGMLPSSTLTGVFFDDLNDNGLRDEGENGFAHASVRLRSADGDIDLTEPVAADGTYFFDGVMPGEYTLTYLLPPMSTMANVAEGGNTLAAQGEENVLEGFKAESGKAYTAPLVGAVTLGSFSGTVYHDQNGNGAREEGEETLAGTKVQISLTGGTGEPAETVSGGDGTFAIQALRPGAYTLAITLPDGYIFSADIAESGLPLPAAQHAEPPCTWETLTNRAQNSVGAVKPATIRASVWLDEDRDGGHQEGERLLNGLTYSLYDEALGRVVATVAAGDDGYAVFDAVRPGTYAVQFALPAQAEPAGGEGTFALQGGMMAHGGIAVNEGDTFEEVSGGLVSRTSIGGQVALRRRGLRYRSTRATRRSLCKPCRPMLRVAIALMAYGRISIPSACSCQRA
jgi:protocatechuate 3,4-dioxygenase beta subunit